MNIRRNIIWVNDKELSHLLAGEIADGPIETRFFHVDTLFRNAVNVVIKKVERYAKKEGYSFVASLDMPHDSSGYYHAVMGVNFYRIKNPE
ncbi:MAG: hypothetical protein Q8Q42_04310 [Nanoarchaeota archaeon]|nr:hypothetical protein [Nanoarchaeota archaeon]